MRSGGPRHFAVLALAGGVGGAKLADGLQHLLGERLTVLVNTGDDFEHVGFHISPDLDTIMYTLAGVANPELGWGVAGESWAFMDQLAQLGGPTWFRLGDRDLATHALRTQRLRAGDTLTEVTGTLCRALGVHARVLPMSDDPVRTIVHSGGETYAFQDYFVRLQCQPAVTAVTFQGAESARYNAQIEELAAEPGALGIVICPSNPYLSVDPILAVPGLRDWLERTQAPVVAVSPIVGGAAVKGPAAKIMRELGVKASASAVAEHYRGLIHGFVLDEADAADAHSIANHATVRVTNTLMRSTEDRVRVAATCIDLLSELLRART